MAAKRQHADAGMCCVWTLDWGAQLLMWAALRVLAMPQVHLLRRPLLVIKMTVGSYDLAASIHQILSIVSPLKAVVGPSLHEAKESFVHIVDEFSSNEEMLRLFNAADAYVSASQTGAFQLPLAEAAASGLPIIVPSGGAAEEIVDSTTTTFVASLLRPRATKDGFVVVPTHESLVTSMSHVLQDFTLRKKVVSHVLSFPPYDVYEFCSSIAYYMFALT